jgi:hypothetical protein
MRKPYTRHGDFLITYLQMPYNDRYYFIDYQGRHIARIKYYDLVLVERLVFPLGTTKRWAAFLNRVSAYNKWLYENND